MCELVAFGSAHEGVAIEAVHLEVLMPAFAIGETQRVAKNELLILL